MDILSFPALRESHFALVDVDETKLAYAGRVAQRVIREGKFPATFEVTTDRRTVLENADYVVCMILHGGIDVIRHDIDIPTKYGVSQCIGDTLGPGGVFRTLRTAPVMVDLCHDMEELCPDALLLNYTNPMAMLCWSMYAASDVRLVGLCHSVQGTTMKLAEAAGVPYAECDYVVAGINHQAWVLQMRHRGRDLYPEILQSCRDGTLRTSEPVRSEMCSHFDYFVTEGSGHNSEYVPWFRKRQDILDEFCPKGCTWNGDHGFIKVLYGDNRTDWKAGMEKIAGGSEPLDFKRSPEYGSYILNACETNEPFRFNGNVANTGLITNLPEGCCVEVPCLADKAGVTPCFIGDLPPHLAGINRTNVSVQELAVEAALTGDREAAFQAVALDPLTAAVCSLKEIRAMVDELFEAEADYLPQFGDA
jgi:alpha-galactosidase